MGKPVLLDLYCCEGGASKGYHDAGFEVEGVDIDPTVAKRYPFTFTKMDAVEYLERYGHRYAAVSGSPPCQGYSVTAHSLTKAQLAKHPLLISKTRRAMKAAGKPSVIENVVGAPLFSPVLLCGSMFGLTATEPDGSFVRLERHRIFESNVPIHAPGPCRHDKSIPVAGDFRRGGAAGRSSGIRGGYTPVKAVRADLLGVHRMSQLGMSEAIPPAYTKWLGGILMEHLER